jgi:hypothetical protein
MNATATIDPRFITHRGDREFVLYAGLLDMAHREGLRRITTKLVQVPSAENGQLAIVWAEVETNRGAFTGIGDASPDNVGRMVALHTIRMAETRAKARALRDAINVGVTALEELGPDEDNMPAHAGFSPVNAFNTTYKTEGRIVSTDHDPVKEFNRSTVSPASSATVPASTEQLQKLVKLHAALGRPANIPASIGQEAAAAQIAELVRIFNAQAQHGGTHHA